MYGKRFLSLFATLDKYFLLKKFRNASETNKLRGLPI